jgi:hypothetical protein
MSSLELELSFPGFGRFNMAASGTTFVARSDPYFDPWLGVTRIDTEIVDAHMQASHRDLGDIDVLVGTCYGLEPSCGVVMEIPGRQDSVWSAFGIRPKLVFDNPPPGFREDETSAVGACLEGDSIIMLSVINALPPCGTAYYPPGQYQVTFVDCCTGKIAILSGQVIHVGHHACAPDSLESPPRSRNINLKVNILDSEPGVGADPGVTRLKLVSNRDCADPVLDSGPVTLDGGEAPRETAYLLASAMQDSLSSAPNCDCEIDTVDTGGREGLIDINCRITFGDLGVCLYTSGTDSTGVLIEGLPYEHLHQLYGEILLEEDHECSGASSQ